MIELDWDTMDALPPPPPLQQWIEISALGAAKRTFILAPYCPSGTEQHAEAA